MHVYFFLVWYNISTEICKINPPCQAVSIAFPVLQAKVAFDLWLSPPHPGISPVALDLSVHALGL